jgi:hypothetical protein
MSSPSTIFIPSSGGVSGTGVDNQISVWSGGSSQDGDANLTWDGSVLTAIGNILTGSVAGSPTASSDSGIQISDTTPTITLDDTDGGVDSKIVQIFNSGGTLQFQLTDDSLLSPQVFFEGNVSLVTLPIGELLVGGPATAATANGEGVIISRNTPALTFNDLDAPLDEKFWEIRMGSGDLEFWVLNDTGADVSKVLDFIRTGATANRIACSVRFDADNGLTVGTTAINAAGGSIAAGNSAANQMYWNADTMSLNVWNGSNILGGNVVPGLYLAHVQPEIVLDETDQAVDARVWTMRSLAGVLEARVDSDDRMTTENWLEVTRSTDSVSSVTFPNGDLIIGGDSLSHFTFWDATATTENIALFAGSAPDWQSMDRGFFEGSVETEPDTAPSGGLFRWVDGLGNTIAMNEAAEISEYAVPEKREWWWQANGNDTTPENVGMGASTTTGSAAQNDGATGPFIQYDTSTTINSDAGWNGSTNGIRTDWSPVMTAYIATDSAITDVRFWIGMFSGDPMGSADPALHLAAFRYDTAADGTAFWRTATKDGTTINVTTTTIAIATGTAYNLRIDARDSSSIKFYIDGVLAATHTTNLPTSSTDLDAYAELRNLTAASKFINLNKVHVSSR